MKKKDILSFVHAPDETPIVVRLFINGQYMGRAKIVDNFNFIDDDIVIDADFELFEMEKK